MMKRFDTLVPGDFLVRSEHTVVTPPAFVQDMRVGGGQALPMWECYTITLDGERLPYASLPDVLVEVSHNVGVQDTLF